MGHAWVPQSPPSTFTDSGRERSRSDLRRRGRQDPTVRPKRRLVVLGLHRAFPRAVQAASPPSVTTASPREGRLTAGACRTAPNRRTAPPQKRDGDGAEIARPPAAFRTTLPVRLRGAGRPLRRRAHGVRAGVSGSRTLLW